MGIIVMVINMTNNFHCGERVRQLRLARALSQEQLALEANITPSYLGMIERGKKNPTVKTVEAICNALGIRLRDFFDTELEVPPVLNPYLDELSPKERAAYAQLIRLVMSIQRLN